MIQSFSFTTVRKRLASCAPSVQSQDLMITSFAQSAKMHRSHSFIILVWFQVFRGQNQPHTVFSSRRHKYFLPWTVQFWWGWCLHQVFSPRFEAQPDYSMVGGRLYHRVPILLVFHKRYRFFKKRMIHLYSVLSAFWLLVSCVLSRLFFLSCSWFE